MYNATTTKGPLSAATLTALARELESLQPSGVDLDGEHVDIPTGDDEADWLVALEVAVATDERIRALLAEATAAGDLVQVAICSIALEECTGHEAYLDGLADSEHRDLTNPTEARALCGRVIADARAMADE